MKSEAAAPAGTRRSGAEIELFKSPTITRARAVEILTTPSIVEDFFRTRLFRIFPSGMALQGCRPKIMRNRVGSRQVIAYKMHFVDRRERKCTSRMFVIKRYADPREGARTYLVTRILWENGFDRQGHLRVSEPFCFFDDLGFLILELAHGRLLQAILDLGGPAVEPGMKVTAQWISKLHHLDTDLGGGDPQPYDAASIGRMVQETASRVPALRARLEEATALVLARLSGFAERPSVPLHGDFQCENMFISKGKATAVDFDSVCMGDPARDLGTLIAGTRRLVRRGHSASRAIHAGLKVFWEEYLSAVAVEERESLSARTCAYAALRSVQDLYYVTSVVMARNKELPQILLGDVERYSAAARVEDVLEHLYR